MTRRILAAALALGALAALVALSQVPWSSFRRDEARLRLSWRARGEPIEECRRLTPEEVTALPIHMRREEVCEGRLAPYRLTVRLDGRVVLSDSIAPGGARADRPIYVLRELPIAGGTYALDVRFERAAGAADTAGGAPTAPRLLALDTVVTARPGDILLVTHEEGATRLVVR